MVPRNKRGSWLASIFIFSVLAIYTSSSLQVKMAPKKRKQRVGALNYQKRKDVAGEDGADRCGLGSAEARVECCHQHGEVVVEGSGEARIDVANKSDVKGLRAGWGVVRQSLRVGWGVMRGVRKEGMRVDQVAV